MTHEEINDTIIQIINTASQAELVDDAESKMQALGDIYDSLANLIKGDHVEWPRPPMKFHGQFSRINTVTSESMRFKIPGHDITALVDFDPETDDYASWVYDNHELLLHITGFNRGKCFMSYITNKAMQGVAYRVGRRRRKSAKKNAVALIGNKDLAATVARQQGDDDRAAMIEEGAE